VDEREDMERPAEAPFNELAGTVNLMAHPLAGMAALSAIGFGFASQALGAWMGAMAGAAQASQRLMEADLAEAGRAVALNKAADRARAAADTLMADAKETAEAVIELAERVIVRAPAAEVPAAKAPGGRGSGRKASAAKAPPAKASAGKTKAETLRRKVAPAAAPVALMPEDFRRPKSMAKPAAPDDLKAIDGVGPKLEKVLNGLGVWTYRQIAGWTAEEIAWVDDYLAFKGRIERDGWTAQAARLAKAAAKK
jgi:NADH-quinone oxidoreductase subunit E